MLIEPIQEGLQITLVLPFGQTIGLVVMRCKGKGDHLRIGIDAPEEVYVAIDRRCGADEPLRLGGRIRIDRPAASVPPAPRLRVVGSSPRPGPPIFPRRKESP